MQTSGTSAVQAVGLLPEVGIMVDLRSGGGHSSYVLQGEEYGLLIFFVPFQNLI